MPRHITDRFLIALTALLAFLATGCIKNDIPYPRIQANFTEFEAEGLASPAAIDTVNRIITLSLTEEADIRAVNVTSYAISPGATLEYGNLAEPLNLTRPYVVTLFRYYNYDWVIRAEQTIERYFTVENQIGATVIDATARRVIVTVPESSGASKVKVLSQKLGPQGSLETPYLVGQTVDMTEPVIIDVQAWGERQQWEVFCETVKSTVNTQSVDAWTQVAWVYCSAVEGRDNGVEYRRAGSEEWVKAPASWITDNGSTFSCRLINLTPETEYETRAYSDDERGAVLSFTTGNMPFIPNMNFSEWSKPGKFWCPWAEGTDPYWDTGNKGAATLGDGNVFPTDDTATGTGQACLMQTRFIGIGVLGKLGAGSIFAGTYVKTVGTNGVLSFGRPFDMRPTKLRGYVKYKSVPIDYAQAPYENLKGQPDTCIIWCALVDSAEPFEIRTSPSDRHLFNPDGPEVIAYGSFQSGKDIPSYVPFEIELNYRSTSRVPKYILMVASASKYGDYFTGGNGSDLYIDDFELLYDY